MKLAGTSRLDPDTLAPPGRRWGAHLLLFAIVAALGFGAAVLTAVFPLIGVGAASGLVLMIAVVRVPEILLVLFVFSLGVPIQLNLGGLPVNATDGVLILWLVATPFILLRRGSMAWQMPFGVKAIIPFAAAVLLSLILASDPPGQYKQFMRVAEWFIILPLALSIFPPDGRTLRFVGFLLLVAPCVFAIDGIVEMLNNGNSISRMLGIPVPTPEDTSRETIHHTYDVSGRAGSTFGGAQGLAFFLAIFLSISMAHLVRAPSRALRVTAACSAVICVGGLVAAQSRGGYIGAGAAAFAIAALEFQALRRLAVLGGGMILAAGVLVLATWPGWDGTVVELVPGSRVEGVVDRLAIWQTALSVWRDHPWFGVGLSNFRDHALNYKIDLLVPLGYESFHAHSTYIEILVDTGLVGLVSYACFLVVTFVGLLRSWRMARHDRRLHRGTFAMAAIGALVTYLVFASVDMLLLQNLHMMLVLFLYFGLLRGEVGKADAQARREATA